MFGQCLGAQVDNSHKVTASYLSTCYLAFSLLRANFFLQGTSVSQIWDIWKVK